MPVPAPTISPIADVRKISRNLASVFPDVRAWDHRRRGPRLPRGHAHAPHGAVVVAADALGALLEVPLLALEALGHRKGEYDKAIADFGRTITLMQSGGKTGWELAFMYFMRATCPGF